uniref:Integrase catalytic domain-containing protein n=1 Tax=Tanacetum cinerariifolium TaxID=118510 RepID=A0A6L2LGB4_TANCI|nr:hypothetical protein [Tanacetum cinerariifolium]
MEQPNPTFARILILDTRKIKQWKFRIQQYLQNEHYALWEVIEFSDSYEAPQEVADTGLASEGSAKKKERTVVVTTEDMQKRRNDTAQELWAATLKTFGGNEATRKTKKNQLKQQYGNFKAEGKQTLEQTFNRLQAIKIVHCGCSRHMTGNISYFLIMSLMIEGGGKITGKGIIKTGKLKFENVYFVKDLKYNLFSVSQIYDNKNSVLFTDSECIVLGRDFKLRDDTDVLLRTPRQHNMYSIDLNNIVPHKDLTCLVAKASADKSVLWHRRLGHLNFKTMDKLVRHNLVRGLPSKCFENDHTCVACLKNFITEIESLKDLKVKIIMCDSGGEFRNKKMNDFCSRKGIKREFSNARTPQQNVVTERRNRTLIEAARTMVLVNKSQNKTPYELFNGRTPAIGFLKPFGCHVMILNTLDNLGKFDAKRDEGTKDVASQDVKKDVSSLRYIALPNWFHEAHLESSTSNAQDACNVDAPESTHLESSTSNAQDACNVDAPESSGNSNPTATSINPPADHLETLTVESLIPTINDSLEPSSDTRLISKRVTSQDNAPSLDNILTLSNRFEDILGVTTNTDDSNGVEADLGNMEYNISASPTPPFRIHKDHPKSQIIDPMDTSVLKNKKDKKGRVIRNKARLVAQGHTQEEGIDYEEVFAPVAKIKAIRLFLAYASFMAFIVYQIDVKSAFLYGTIDEEVYVMQTLGFQDPEFLAKVYKVEKVMYGLHQALRAWSHTAKTFDLVWIWSGGDYGNLFLMGFTGIQWVGLLLIIRVQFLPLGIVPTARLTFCDYHNMVAILEKYEHNIDFHQIVDLVEAFRLRIKTTDEGTKILATVDEIFFSKGSVFPSMKVSNPYHYVMFESKEYRRARIAQSSALPTAADEPASPLGDDSQGEACPTVTGLEAGQDRATIIKTSTLPSDSTPRVTSLAADEDTQELEITSLKARIKLLEDKDGERAEPSGEDATIKGRSLETEEEAANILTSEVQVVSVPPAAEVVTVSVPTGSGLFPTASPIFTTASVVTPYSRRKGKEKMVESDTPKKKKLQKQIDVQVASEIEEQMVREDQRMNEQIARDAEIARIHEEEELQMMKDCLDKNNKVIARHLHEYEQAAVELTIGEKIELINKLIEDFIPMASKEVGERFKRKGLRLEQESPKKMKTSKDVSEEDPKQMMQLVPVEEVYVEALQVKHPIIDWEIHTEGQRTYWKIIRLGGRTVVYQFFIDMLKHFDRKGLNQVWNLVKETLSIRQATSKEKMVESDTPKKKKLQKQIDVQVAREIEEQMVREDQRMNKQIARDAEIARIHEEEELQMMKDSLDKNNKVIARHLHEYEQAAVELTIGEKIELINKLVKYQDHYSKILKGAHKVDKCDQNMPPEQVCLSRGDIYDDPSLLKFYQNDDVPSWGTGNEKKKEKAVLTWSSGENLRMNFLALCSKKFQTKGLGEMLDQHVIRPDAVKLWLRHRHKIESSRSDLNRVPPDAVVNFPMSSLERLQRRRFIPVTPSPCIVCTILQEIWHRSAVLSVSSPNEPKSRVFPPNAI